ncbi:tRNA lysidine(34) synthetase TilS [Subtercola boreus]|uniref:tRNA(Ile)-lysidine synthase n=1 Tax=Subtercola boreus TaxID=120213 RepID=A0A3E0W8P4_9MICO|nr:tRNA lysidine(34) synthetase TilS [Subtercola boreus]RFA18265.1 tRNA lysidine(34) synthetase TilS [Subtercola boreus]RFA18657.1 tRNA lysidine(34) synthetase TilS [Subtercola boreus]RFA25260.1 tRNA lysidine(34) synthetase TilS [Subtercola boreus]
MRPPDRRPRLTPAMADVRRAVREALGALHAQAPDARQPLPAEAAAAPLVLVALSGGPDSLALAAATAFEAPRAGLRAGAVIVDHALQPGSAEVSAAAAAHARALGLDPVIVTRVHVDPAGPDGPEAAARAARYVALGAAREATGATQILLGHTLDDQAETVLLGLARGSGPSSLSGMSAVNGAYGRPLLGIRRQLVHQSIVDLGLEPWHDPQNLDPAYTRVRVRQTVLPMLETELGPGIAEALARTADQLREDDEALDALAAEWAAEIVEHAEAGIAVDVHGLASNPPALAQRVVRFVVASEFGVSLSRAQTLSALRLVTQWHGQSGVDLPGIRVTRVAGSLVFTRH